MRDLAGSTQAMTQSITALAYSPDGKQALVGDADGVLRLWDVFKGKMVQSLGGHTEVVAAVVIGPDGHTGLSGGRDNLMKLWNLDTGSASSLDKARPARQRNDALNNPQKEKPKAIKRCLRTL